MENCQHCNQPNKDKCFYCRSCGKKAFVRKITNTMFMRSEIGKSTDIEFSTLSMDYSIKKMNQIRNAS